MRPAIGRVGTVTAALCLSACVSLLPKSEPANLYRFGKPPPAVAVSANGTVGVLRAVGTFQREAAGDRILTVNDGQVAYIAEARWAAPAATLWEQAVQAAFDADPGPVRMVGRGDPMSVDHVLRLDVRNFETTYDQGPKSAPEILVRVRAVLVPAATPTAAREQVVESRVRAGANRVSAIVAAYEQAVGEVLGEVVAWTTAGVGPT